ncbi:MAG TPA: 2OG-Fe(II) oxygenase [Euzebyales bacterium]|nr:2OG-Fe(II) oxygenase [Euzebyales bacterium]
MVTRGERGPDFVARRGDGQPTRFYGYAGGSPVVVVFSGADGGPAARAVRDHIVGALDRDVRVYVIATGPEITDNTTFHDPDGMVHAAYGLDADDDPAVVVLDANVRVAAAHVHRDPETTVSRVASVVAEVTIAGEGSTIRRHAPVLLIPHALDLALCTRLIELWASSDTAETGVEATAGGARGEATDRSRKRRRDHTVTDPGLLRTLSSHVGRRVMPELRKAFAYEAKRFEGFKIGCYLAEDRGFFTAHRDNISPTTAHRKFALTLNLNDDYEGGELRFPEYGPDRYRPAAGEALVFSGAHLHEVLPVSRGRRFVLLSFLFGDLPAAA